jgi:hypothetical protein
MSNPTKAPPPTLAERVAKLEKYLPAMEERLFSAFDGTLSQHRMSMQNLAETIAAVIRLSGEGFNENVLQEVERARVERMKAELSKNRDVVQQLVDTGSYIVTDTITNNSLMIAKTTDKDGNPVGAGETYGQFNQLAKTEQEALLGKKVGYVREYPDGGKAEITGIWEPNPNYKPPETAPETVSPVANQDTTASLAEATDPAPTPAAEPESK